ncbi:zf-CCHC domain-containing protein [Cucumis melo var. makuwa]|uniref:Zf-CCHC domain-containing protein n=1 Tax=Cucumis melo var. makuwa TaxID=1194695 RepID=A0A5D3DU61_CUCMM|nr:zf-CCHC domain-containing protein [Cucumis melo var. makuwa]
MENKQHSLLESVEEIIELSSRENTRRGPWNANTNNKASTACSSLTQSKSVEEIIELSSRENTRRGPWNANTNNKASTACSSLTQSSKEPNLSKCFRRGQTGHLSNSCPKRKTVAILEDDEDLIEEQEGDFDHDEEILEPDEGERLSCVLQRVLIAPKNDISHQQRHSLFKTRRTIQSKVCNMIIDSGSNKNFVSKKLVTALKLKIEPHSNPYKIGWIKKCGDA